MDLKLIELLICPVTQGKLEYDRENQVLISKAAGLVFPIRDDIPILLEAQAMPLEEWEKTKPDEAAEYFAKVAQQDAESEEVVDDTITDAPSKAADTPPEAEK